MNSAQDPKIQNLLDDLQNGSATKRRAAAYKLGNLKNTVTVPALIEATKSEDLILRQNAINALREIEAQKNSPENNGALDKETSSKNERLWASFAHFCILLPVLPCLLIYFRFKNKSRFIAVHALQALKFQIVFALLAFVIPGVAFASSADPSTNGGLMLYSYCIMFPISMGFPFLGLIASVEAQRGKSYKYPFRSDKWV